MLGSGGNTAPVANNALGDMMDLFGGGVPT